MFTAEECPFHKREINGRPCRGGRPSTGKLREALQTRGGMSRGALVPSTSQFQPSSKGHVLTERLLKPRLKDRRGRHMRLRGPHRDDPRVERSTLGPRCRPRPSPAPHPRLGTQACLCRVPPLTPALGTEPFFFFIQA